MIAILILVVAFALLNENSEKESVQYFFTMPGFRDIICKRKKMQHKNQFYSYILTSLNC